MQLPASASHGEIEARLPTPKVEKDEKKKREARPVSLPRFMQHNQHYRALVVVALLDATTRGGIDSKRGSSAGTTN